MDPNASKKDMKNNKIAGVNDLNFMTIEVIDVEEHRWICFGSP